MEFGSVMAKQANQFHGYLLISSEVGVKVLYVLKLQTFETRLER